MSNRKNQDGEQQVIKLIDDIVQNKGNFNFDRLKEKINKEKEQEDKNTDKQRSRYIFYSLYKYAYLTILIGLIFLSIIFIDNKLNTPLLMKNNDLSEALIDSIDIIDIDEGKNQSIFDLSFYTVMLNKDKECNYVEIDIPISHDGTYYAAYLSNKMLNKVNMYFNKYNIINSPDYTTYLSLVNRTPMFKGIDNRFINYYYYSYLNNLSNEEIINNINWIEYTTFDFIKYNVKQYSLLTIVTTSNITKIKDIKNNIYLNNTIKYMDEVCVELDSSTKELSLVTKPTYSSKKYLYNINDNIGEVIYLNQTILNTYYAEIVYENNIQCVYGIIPKWYERYYKRPDLIDVNCLTTEEKDFLSSITKYKSYELFDSYIYDEKNKINKIYKYYNYEKVKYLILE